jgi:hypothetical protein
MSPKLEIRGGAYERFHDIVIQLLDSSPDSISEPCYVRGKQKFIVYSTLTMTFPICLLFNYNYC